MCTSPHHKAGWTQSAHIMLVGGGLALEGLLWVQAPKGSILPILMGLFFFSRFVIKSLQCELKVHRFMMLKSWDVGFRLVTVAALFLQD